MRSAGPLAILVAAAVAAAAGCSSARDDAAVRTVEVTRTVTVSGAPANGDDGVPGRTVDAVPADDAPDAVTAPLAPGGARAAVRRVTRHLGYTPEFASIGLYGSYAILRVRDRARPRNLDAYTVRTGRVSGPDPVRIDGDRVAGEVFPLSAVDLDAVPRLVARAQRLDLEDAEVCCVIVQRAGGAREVAFHVNVSGSRESAQLRADARGRVTGIVR